jgi:CubicO group peptidase (beta-lactamase class C family)
VGAIVGAALVQAPAAAEPVPTAERLEQALQAMVPPVRVEGRTYQPRPVTDLMARENVPGISVAVVEDGRIVWARAYGVADSATGSPVTPETLFQAASISKPVAASGALALVDAGVLSLDRPVNEQLTSWQVPAHDFAEQVTLRRLLGHNAGVTVHGFPGYRTDAALPTVVQVLNGAPPANTAAVRVDLQPGSRYRYSGGGTTVAQLLMTDATGEPFPALMDRLVLRPLGMTSSTYAQPLPDARAAQAASAHGPDGRPIAGRFHVYPEMFAAGLWTTPTDLAKWSMAITSAYNGGTAGPIRPETARAMLTPGMGNWGLGIALQGEGRDFRFWHSGINEGFRAVMMSYPGRNQAVVIMANGDNGNELLGPVRIAVGRVLGWPGSEQQVITPATVRREPRIEQVGHYVHERFSVHVGLTEDGLILMPSRGDRFEGIPQSEDVYAATNGGGPFQFERDPRSGRITGLAIAGLTLRRMP